MQSTDKDNGNARRPGAKSVNKPVINKANVKPRIYEPKSNTANKQKANNVQPVIPQQRKTTKSTTNADTKLAHIKPPVEKKVEPTKLEGIEKAIRDSLEQMNSELMTIANSLKFSSDTLDEASYHCDESETYLDLYNFYKELLDLSDKMEQKLAMMQNTKTNFLNAVHDSTRFISRNFLPFRDGIDARKKRIFELIETAKAEEREQRRLNPLPKPEMKDVEVQVTLESIITYSPTAGILRSSVSRKVVMPPFPALRTLGTPASTRGQQYMPSHTPSRITSNVSFINCEDVYNSVNHVHHKSPITRRIRFDDTLVGPYEKLDNITGMCDNPAVSSPSCGEVLQTEMSETRYQPSQSMTSVSMPKEPILRSTTQKK